MKTIGDNATLFKWLGGAVVAIWLQMPTAAHFLLLFMALDIATGLVAGFIERKLASDVSYRGLARKVLILLMVGAAHVIVKAMGLQFDLGSAVATVYMVNEVISILENCARAGVPVPSVLVQALAKVKKTARAATPAEIAALGSCPNGKEQCDPKACDQAKDCELASKMALTSR